MVIFSQSLSSGLLSAFSERSKKPRSKRNRIVYIFGKGRGKLIGASLYEAGATFVVAMVSKAQR